MKKNNLEKVKVGLVINDSGISVKTDLNTLQQYAQKPASVLAEIATGILASDKKEHILSIGRLVQSGIKLRLVNQFFEELKQYQEKGKIKDDYWEVTTNQASFVELMQYIDKKDTPEETVFQAMKSIFFTSIAKDSDTNSDILGYQYLQICKEFTSMDLLVLKACFDLYDPRDSEEDKSLSYNRWISIIASKIATGMPTVLVTKSGEKLQTLGICVTPRVRQGVRLSALDDDQIKTIKPEHGLSELGISIGLYISEYKTSKQK